MQEWLTREPPVHEYPSLKKIRKDLFLRVFS